MPGRQRQEDGVGEDEHEQRQPADQEHRVRGACFLTTEARERLPHSLLRRPLTHWLLLHRLALPRLRPLPSRRCCWCSSRRLHQHSGRRRDDEGRRSRRLGCRRGSRRRRDARRRGPAWLGPGPGHGLRFRRLRARRCRFRRRSVLRQGRSRERRSTAEQEKKNRCLPQQRLTGARHEQSPRLVLPPVLAHPSQRVNGAGAWI